MVYATADGAASQKLRVGMVGGGQGAFIGAVHRLAARMDDRFELVTDQGTLRCRSLVVATGGKSIPKMGATGLAYQLALKFGLAWEVARSLPGVSFIATDCSWPARRRRPGSLRTSGPHALDARAQGRQLDFHLLDDRLYLVDRSGSEERVEIWTREP